MTETLFPAYVTARIRHKMMKDHRKKPDRVRFLKAAYTDTLWSSVLSEQEIIVQVAAIKVLLSEVGVEISRMRGLAMFSPDKTPDETPEKETVPVV